MADRVHTLGDASLTELLDRLVETGVVATGDLVLGLADVDLVRVSLQLVLGSVDKLAGDDAPRAGLEQPVAAAAVAGGAGTGVRSAEAPSDTTSPNSTTSPVGSTSHSNSNTTSHADITSHSGTTSPARLPELGDADRGIGALLVAVVELVRQLLERQAIHRMERGSLTDEQVERLGRALQDLDQKVGQLVELFGGRSSELLPLTALN